MEPVTTAGFGVIWSDRGALSINLAALLESLRNSFTMHSVNQIKTTFTIIKDERHPVNPIKF